MEATRLIEALTEYRKQYEQPVSYLQVMRDLVLRAQNPSMPPMFTEEQRKLLLSNLDCLTSFLACEEGADAIELLIDSFKCYLARYEKDHPVLKLPDAAI